MSKTPYLTSVKNKQDKKITRDPTIVLMSVKPISRMKSYGPTQLLNLGDNCLIDIQIEAIKSVYQSFELIICCGFEADKVIKYVKNKYSNLNIKIIENQLYEQYNDSETLRLCLNAINTDSLLICNGEILVYPELLRILSDSPYVLSQNKVGKNHSFQIGSVVDDLGFVTNMSFGLPNTWSEIFYLPNKESIEYLRKVSCNLNNKNKFIFELLNDISGSKINLRQIFIDSEVYKIDEIKTYHKIREIYESTGSQLFIRNFY